MSRHTHIVIVYNHETKSFSYDDDGTEVWIRRLFSPESNTWSDAKEDFIGNDGKLLKHTIKEFEKLNERATNE